MICTSTCMCVHECVYLHVHGLCLRGPSLSGQRAGQGPVHPPVDRWWRPHHDLPSTRLQSYLLPLSFHPYICSLHPGLPPSSTLLPASLSPQSLCSQKSANKTKLYICVCVLTDGNYTWYKATLAVLICLPALNNLANDVIKSNYQQQQASASS